MHVLGTCNLNGKLKLWLICISWSTSQS